MEEYINVVIITLNKNGLEIGFQHKPLTHIDKSICVVSYTVF